jgi:hypothetical protein
VLGARASSFLLPCEISLGLERNSSCNLGISRWREVCLLHIGRCNSVEETHVSLQKKSPLSEKLQHLAHSFPVRIELVFKGILPATWVFQSGHRLSLLQTSLFNWVENLCISWKKFIGFRTSGM